MDILQYNDLRIDGLGTAFERVVGHLKNGDFRAADARKMHPGPYYRAKLNDADRLLFQFAHLDGRPYLLLLEIIRNHHYDKSRFLKGARLDESRLEPLPNSTPPPDQTAPLVYVNPNRSHFHVLDKVLSFDDEQETALHLSPPVILIGSAGSGKTVLCLEKLKQLPGDILYVTRSSFLTENARDRFYALNYDNEDQTVDFLSYKEYLESLRVPAGKPVGFRDFAVWYRRRYQPSLPRNVHMVFEEFNGVLTGSDPTQPFLTRENYLSLGVRQSIFTDAQRPLIYDLFSRYVEDLPEQGWFDLNIEAFRSLDLARPNYDYVVVDEVQDLTNVQLLTILKSLRIPTQFILCGDANQVVHPNFFSWTGVKSLFYRQPAAGSKDIIRILSANYRNSPEVTALANRLLLLKQARFGSIDRESNYLIRSLQSAPGCVELLSDSDATLRELDDKTRQSVRFAVLCLRPEDKESARRFFRTPLLFSIHEAKGLEYENVILFNFVSENHQEYQALLDNVSPADLEGPLKFGRAADKTDKSLDAYKFFINALYVALTRSIRNVYLVERNPRHPLFALLKLTAKESKIALTRQQSTLEEWKDEARKLELQGKQEQADAIRTSILKIQPVPWPVLTPFSLEQLTRDAFNPAHFNKQAKQLLYEYAVECHVPHLIDRLLSFKFNRAARWMEDIPVIRAKYTQDCCERTPQELRRKIALYGVDFRNPLNQTALMQAAQIGRADVIGELTRAGAKRTLRDNWGRTPLQIALRESFLDTAFARQNLGSIYPLLAPSSMNVKTFGRLIKLDCRQMEFFLLNSMIALLQEILRKKIVDRIPGFQTADFVGPLADFPENAIPHRRRRRTYLTSVLARNEIHREEPHTRKLFLRIAHGHYLPSPLLEIETGEDEWTNVYDLVHLGELEKEGDPNLKYFAEYIREIRTRFLPGGVAGK